MPDAKPVAPRSTEDTTSDSFEAFLRLADLWDLSTEQRITLLGSPARSTYFKWRKERASMSADTEERISHLLAIFKALQILFPDPDRADTWLRRSNSFFEERSAMDVMLGGQLADILTVRAYLDAQRGG